MDKKLVVGIIIAIAFVAGIVSIISYNNIFSAPNLSDTTTELAKTGGKNFTIELRESIDVVPNP